MTSTFKPKWPDDFHGEESKWYEWSFQTRAYVAASKIFEAKYLREAEKNSDPITFDALDSVSRTNASSQGKDPDLEAADAHDRNEQLYHLLSMLCKSAALTLVRHVEEGNGLEAWRQMSRKFDKRDDTSSMGLMQSIMNFDFGDGMNIFDRITAFEILVNKFNAQNDLEPLQDSVKRGILLRGLKDPLRTHIQMNQVALKSYDTMKNTVIDFSNARRA